MRKFKVSLTLDQSADADFVEGHVHIPCSGGKIKRVLYVTPDLATTGKTATYTFKDKDGHTVHTKSGLAEAATTDEASLDKPFTTFGGGTGVIPHQGLELTIDLSAETDADATFDAYIWVDEK